VSKNDPTEDVLATIARIFEHADAIKAKPPIEPRPYPERPPIVNPFAPEELTREPVPEVAPQVAAEIPTETSPVEELSASDSAAPEIGIAEYEPEAPRRSEDAEPMADGYMRLGPGPLDAIRFRWTARATGGGSFFVDETIGPKSRAISSGPMSGDDAMAFIDLQVQEAFERFERLKQSAAEMPTQREAHVLVEQVHAEHDASEDQGF